MDVGVLRNVRFNILSPSSVYALKLVYLIKSKKERFGNRTIRVYEYYIQNKYTFTHTHAHTCIHDPWYRNRVGVLSRGEEYRIVVMLRATFLDGDVGCLSKLAYISF